MQVDPIIRAGKEKVAAKTGLFRDTQEPQADLLRRLRFDHVIPLEVGDLFHHIRILGNRATHENEGNHADGLTALEMARQLGIWFHRTFGAGKAFAPGAFVPPPDPAEATQALTKELARLREELDEHRTAAEKARALAEDNRRARAGAEELARKEREDRAVWEQIAAEAEHAKAALATQLQILQAAAAQAPAQLTGQIAAKAEAAARARTPTAGFRPSTPWLGTCLRLQR
jgi:type I restriction enzyme R subunit